MLKLRSLPKLLLLIVFVMALVAVLLSKASVTAQTSPAQPTANLVAAKPARTEIRGVWITNVDSEVLFNRDRLNSAVDELAKLNFNTLYPTVWNWGYTQYPSAVAKAATGANVDPRPIGLDDRDPLAELVATGHKRGLAVIPWFEFGFMVPADSALALRHPDWLTRRANGKQVWQEGIWARVWLNPFKPEVQQFIQALVLELVDNYDIDGIQMDDHFGLQYEFGYDDFTVALYRQEHQGKSPPIDAKDPAWIQWRANKITQFTKQLFKAVKSRKENVLFTLSPNNYSFSLNHSLQDWHTWQQDGLIEELILQVYRESLTSFKGELATPEFQAARRRIPTAVGILTGLKEDGVPIARIREQVTTARQQGFPGVSFFFYETLWNLTQEPSNDRKAVFRSLFPTPIQRPNLKQGWTPG